MMARLHPIARSAVRIVCGLLVGLALRGANALDLDSAAPASAPIVVGSDVYEPPRAKQLIAPAYPSEESASGIEGWVILSAMVDQSGKPYEAAVVDSTGQKVFEKLALKTLEGWTLIPAQLNGHPIDSVYRVKFHFAVPGRPLGARDEFVVRYRKLIDAVRKNDKAAADAALAKLDVQNLYEDAFKGVAEYSYAVQYGDTDQQIAGLRRAIANESDARYLPKGTFVVALESLLRLQISVNRFGEALDTWRKLQKVSGDKQALAKFKPVIDQVEALRAESRPYSVAGDLKDEGWFIELFKDNFRIEVIKGHVDTLKLRCERNYRTFDYDSQLEYHIAKKSGQCELEIDGSPGSQFKLVQS